MKTTHESQKLHTFRLIEIIESIFSHWFDIVSYSLIKVSIYESIYELNLRGCGGLWDLFDICGNGFHFTILIDATTDKVRMEPQII